MKPINYAIVLIAILLTGCNISRPSTPAQYSYASPEQKTLLTQLVLQSLKDPDSAKFSDVIMVDNGKGACVEVNARNAFGGYTGVQQAMLMNIDNIGWQLLRIKDTTLEVCVTSLHSVISSNR